MPARRSGVERRSGWQHGDAVVPLPRLWVDDMRQLVLEAWASGDNAGHKEDNDIGVRRKMQWVVFG
jgi:hypothetical protein